MSKVQKRLPIGKLPPYFGKNQYFNFILKSGAVHFATPMKLEGKEIQIKNAMRHLLSIPLSDLDEIWIENEV
jgi:hypothetical protein